MTSGDLQHPIQYFVVTDEPWESYYPRFVQKFEQTFGLASPDERTIWGDRVIPYIERTTAFALRRWLGRN
jgi:hypothetical protein